MQRRGYSRIRASLVKWVSSSLQTGVPAVGQPSRRSSWVTAIVLNSARITLRRRLRCIHVPFDEPIGEVQILSVSERLADGRPNPEDEYRNAELSTYLMRFHGRLSPTLRRTFQLRAIDGLSVRETAQILGMPHGTVKAQFARALKSSRSRCGGPRRGDLVVRWIDLPGF